MDWTTWWVFFTTEAALSVTVTPGPAVLYVISSALRCGARKSIASNLGILTANLGYFILSATGVGALIMASYDLFFAVKWIGAAYLIFLGARALLGKANVLAAEGGGPDKSAWRLFADGFVLPASKPEGDRFLFCPAAAIHQPAWSGSRAGGDPGCYLNGS